MSRPATRPHQHAAAAAASGLRDSDSGSAAALPSAAVGPTEPQCHVNAESNKRARNESNTTIADRTVAGPAAAKRAKALAPQPVPTSQAESTIMRPAGSGSEFEFGFGPPALAPIPSAAEGSTAAPKVPTAQSHSPAQRCHTDALHCIFAFLDLAELLPALQSCSQWWAAGVREPPRGRTQRMYSTSVASLAASPLRRHIADLTVYRNVPLRLDELQLLRALPRLTGLTAQLSEADLRARFQSAGPGPDPVGSREQRAQLLRDALPLHLQRLELSLFFFQHSAAPDSRQAMVDALLALSSLTDVRVDLRDAELDLAPLLQLPHLRRIYVGGSPQTAQCGVLKRMSALTSYAGLLCSTDALTELLQSPHSLQRLEELDIDTPVDSAIMAALSQLPVFAVLRPRSIPPECWAGLASLPRLLELNLTWDRSFTSAQRTTLDATLAQLPLLTDLSIWLRADDQVDGPPMTLALPGLRVLSLSELRVPSLGFLQRTPLLESLDLAACTRISADDVLAGLRAHPPLRLRELGLRGCVALSAEQEAALQPPSLLLPSLIEFDYAQLGR